MGSGGQRSLQRAVTFSVWSVLLLLRAFATLQIRLRLMVSRSRGCSARAAPCLRFPSALPVQVTAGQQVLSSAPLLVSI